MTPELIAAAAIEAAAEREIGQPRGTLAGVGKIAVEAISGVEMVIVPAGMIIDLKAERDDALKHNAIIAAMLRDVRAEASADRARVVRYYEGLLAEMKRAALEAGCNA